MILTSSVSSLHIGSVDLRYKLGLVTHKYQLTHRNLADGYPHYVNITRHNRTIKTQVHALIAVTLSLLSITSCFRSRKTTQYKYLKFFQCQFVNINNTQI